MTAEATKSPAQLFLDWPVREVFSEAQFLPSSSNEAAVRWIDQWPRWQRGGEAFHCLIIYGPDGCGKTHLAHVWKQIAEAKMVAMEDLPSLDFSGSEEFVYIIEDVDKTEIDEQTASALFHLYNWLKEQGGYLLLTARRRPKKWGLELADLASRLLASESVKITAPDDDLLRAVILKQFSDRQINLAENVVAYILKHGERSFSFVRALVKSLDDLSMAEKKKITIPMVKRVLEELGEA